MTKRKLSTDDWVLAGFRALSHGGLQAIKVERIAKALKVSKGSFYWHFKDVRALQKAMLVYWQGTGTDIIITLVESYEGSAAQKLGYLVELSTFASEESEKFGGILVEAAIRDWAKYDVYAADILKSVDLRRLSFLEMLFKEAGVPEMECSVYANILYGALIGLAHLEDNKLADQKKDLTSLLEVLLGTVKKTS